MKITSLKIGKYLITKKAIFNILFALFLLGILIGVYVASIEDDPNSKMGIILPMFYIPIVLIIYKPIKKNIIKIK